MVGNRAIHQFLLYNFFVARLVCGNLCVGGGSDGQDVGGVSCASNGGPEEGGLMGPDADGVHGIAFLQRVLTSLHEIWGTYESLDR